MRLEGHEFHYQMMCRPVDFTPLAGVDEDSTAKARYQIPFLGVTVDCKSFLNKDESEIRIQSDLIKGIFSLTPSSRSALASQFK